MRFITTNYFDCYRLIHCSLPANKTVSIGFVTLGLRSIADDFLADYSFVNEIELDWNEISYIGPNTFTNRSLTKVKLTRNKLTDVSRIFCNMPLLEHLDLQMNRIRAIPLDTFHDTPNIRVLSISKGQNSLSSVDFLKKGFDRLEGLTLSFKASNNGSLEDALPVLPSLKYVTLFYEGAQKNVSCPQGVLPNLVTIRIYGSSTICPRFMQWVPNVIHFRVKNCSQTRIDKHFLTNATQLEYLTMASCHIREIHVTVVTKNLGRFLQAVLLS